MKVIKTFEEIDAVVALRDCKIRQGGDADYADCRINFDALKFKKKDVGFINKIGITCQNNYRSRNYFLELIANSLGATKHAAIFDKILLHKDVDSKIKCLMLENGLFYDIQTINKLVDLDELEVLKVIAWECSISKVKPLRKHKRAEIRAIAYKRLGSVDYLDDMLSDRGRSVREQAIHRCPLFYDGLKKLSSEKCSWLLRMIATKMPIDALPFMFGHKIFKETRYSWYGGSVKNIIERRIESYNKTKAKG